MVQQQQQQIICRWAALSLSSIAAVFLPDLLRAREISNIKHEIVAISTTGSDERASKWLSDNKIPNPDSVDVYHSWEEMLERGSFDIVYISTPHPLHYRHVLKALQCRRNVLLEKPATMSQEQYRLLVDLAIKQNVVLMEAMWTRYLPATRYFKETLLPQIGQVKRVYADFSFPIVSPELPQSSRFLAKEAGAGSLLDQGVYALTWADLALNGLDDESTTRVIHANTISVPDVPGEVDDIDTIILSKESGNKQTAVAIVTTSMTIPGSNKPTFYRRLQAPRHAPAVRIEATKASVAVPFPPIRPEELHVIWYGDEYVDHEGIETEQVIKLPVEDGWGLWYQADMIARKVQERKETNTTEGYVIGAEESLRVLGWMDDARRQAGIAYDTELYKTR